MSINRCLFCAMPLEKGAKFCNRKHANAYGRIHRFNKQLQKEQMNQVDVLNQCPNCESDDIHIAIQSDKAMLEINAEDDKFSALKFDSGSDILQQDISCNACKSKLIATKNGYRLA